MSAHRTIGRLLAILRRRHIERELADDIAAHLELAERDALARGLSPEQAHRAARLSFGGVEQVKEAHRDQRGFGWIETLFRDLRYGLASLARTPGFTARSTYQLSMSPRLDTFSTSPLCSCGTNQRPRP